MRGLRREKIDLEQRQITVDHQVIGYGPSSWEVTEPKTKSGNRIIPISSKAHAAIVRTIARAEQENFSATVDGLTGFIVLGHQGSILNRSSFCRILKEICNEYNNEYGTEIKVTLHVLRHTFCTNMYHKGVSALSLQYVMGHTDLTTTMNVYTHNSPTKALDELRKIVNQ